MNPRRIKSRRPLHRAKQKQQTNNIMKNTSAATQEIATLKNTLGKKLFAIALKTPSSTSKKDVLTAVKACKGRRAISQASAVEGILRVASLIFAQRHARNKARSGLNKYGYRPNRPDFRFAPIFGRHRSTVDHTGALAYRLRRHKVSTARRIIGDLMPSLSGDVSGSVQFAADFSGVTFSAGTSRGEQYSRKCTYCKTDGAWTATIQNGWNLHVAKRGLSRVDGMPTLAALPVETETPGEEIFRAKWLEKGRGFAANVRTGYIVRRVIEARTYTAHASSIGTARSLITRQTPESQRAADERAAAKAAQIERLQAKLAAKLEAGQLNGYAPVVVTIGDSLAVGNCGSGTRNWIAKHLPGRTAATVAEIVQIPDEHPRVLLACLHAILRAQPETLTA
jgi:hypothetical protein